ncbi:hypothetical protein F3Y22_tig00111392pilonHSYRG00562 [Hibiscus syriacus]|uniref:Uncharacterized protein n=1 Tax=Hibiscus syriacus TaxID=106335 RepID=A0A6A2YLR5_HIBSY|nr:hypothetical protein F3Y22_tig00111392pilonHSYRG00562 [Hibiscus syriacus]
MAGISILLDLYKKKRAFTLHKVFTLLGSSQPLLRRIGRCYRRCWNPLPPVEATCYDNLEVILLFYLPLLEPSLNTEEEDLLQDSPEERRVDLVVPFKKSVKQIIRETTIVTQTALERLAVVCVSQHMAWKLLKMFQNQLSGNRKGNAYHGVLLQSHLLGVAAAWIVQTGIEIYNCFSRITNSEESDGINITVQAKLLGKEDFWCYHQLWSIVDLCFHRSRDWRYSYSPINWSVNCKFVYNGIILSSASFFLRAVLPETRPDRL